MAEKLVIKKNAYYDSVTLMAISGKITATAGVIGAIVAMATPLNKELIENLGMLTEEVETLGPNDLVIAIKADSQNSCDEAVHMAEESLTQRAAGKKGNKEFNPPSIASAVKVVPDANMALISVPGAYAAREGWQALKNGLHVMMFSDNVSLEDEIALKRYAHKAGLLMMGPDCGTAIINNVGLCFANVVAAGDIGIVGASGTGTQEVLVLVDRFGGGISQALGTGGRDLSEDIGGIMMLDCMAALVRDSSTKVIVLISKPPAKTVTDKILEQVKLSPKPVVVCFINGDAAAVEKAGGYFASTLEEAARKAVSLSKGNISQAGDLDERSLQELAADRQSKLSAGQRYVRGLFCGGTLCDEALHIVKGKTGTVYSNIAKQAEYKLTDPHVSKQHTFIDLGDDMFTVGRPHPMIDPSLRLDRLVEEAKDPTVAVILLDVILGLGSHADPAGVTLPAIIQAKRIAQEAGRYLEVIAYVCGTGKDPQGLVSQEQKLAAAGVTLLKSNARAAQLAAAIVAGRGDKA